MPTLRDRLLVATCCISTLLGGCHAPPPERRIYAVFGTIVEVEIADGRTVDRTVDNGRALDRLDDFLGYLDLNWRTFGPGELGRLNDSLRHGSPGFASAPLARVLQRSLEFSDRSGGLFDVRVGPLVALWGFQDSSLEARAPPGAEEIARLRGEALAPGNVHADANRVWSDSPVTLDFGSIGKGSALAGAAALLRANGLHDFLINAGGDIYALGSHGEKPWRIGVRDPRSPAILGVLTLASGETVSSSGDYERFFLSGGQRYHHIIDPRTGRPSAGTAATTVVCRDAELAHVASTGLMVAGRAGFEALVQRLGIEFALLVTEDGTLIMTPAMRARFVPEGRKL